MVGRSSKEAEWPLDKQEPEQHRKLVLAGHNHLVEDKQVQPVRKPGRAESIQHPVVDKLELAGRIRRPVAGKPELAGRIRHLVVDKPERAEHKHPVVDKPGRAERNRHLVEDKPGQAVRKPEELAERNRRLVVDKPVRAGRNQRLVVDKPEQWNRPDRKELLRRPVVEERKKLQHHKMGQELVGLHKLERPEPHRTIVVVEDKPELEQPRKLVVEERHRKIVVEEPHHTLAVEEHKQMERLRKPEELAGHNRHLVEDKPEQVLPRKAVVEERKKRQHHKPELDQLRKRSQPELKQRKPIQRHKQAEPEPVARTMKRTEELGPERKLLPVDGQRGLVVGYRIGKSKPEGRDEAMGRI